MTTSKAARSTSFTPPRVTGGPIVVEALARSCERIDGSPAHRARLIASWQRPGPLGVFADRIARLFDWSLGEAIAQLQRLELEEAWNAGPVAGTVQDFVVLDRG